MLHQESRIHKVVYLDRSFIHRSSIDTFLPRLEKKNGATSTIKLESSQPSTINLTPWDLELLFLGYSQKGLLYHKPSPELETAILQKTGATSLVHHLKTSLERTLRFFPPLTGRLATTVFDAGGSTSYSIECGHAEGGALFVHAMPVDTSLTVADVLPDCVPAIARSFFPLARVRNTDGVSKPLLAVQVTELVDGFFIGCSINHMLVDGTSFWHFVNSWAEISRGATNDGTISRQPFLSRDQINLDLARSRNISISDEHLNNCAAAQISSSPHPVIRERVFRFTKRSVASLKSRASQELIMSGIGEKIIISSLQVIVAHVWRSINRFASGKETISFKIPMGARQRLNPPLPDEYFGNAVFPGTVTLNRREMLEKGLGWTAWQINRMVRSNNGPEKVKEFYTSWVKKHKLLQGGAVLRRDYLILINSPRFDVYGNDFGWGNPVAARGGPENRSDGWIAISSGLEEGSLEIEASLYAETLHALAEDKEFMEYVCC